MTAPIPTGHERAPTRHAAPSPGIALESLLVAAGGALGSVARAAVGALVESPPGAVVFETQLVNGLGAMALGLLLARLEQSGSRPRLRPFLAVGVLGSFTTYSTLIADAQALADGRFTPVALAYVAASIALGIAAFVLGGRLAGPVARPPAPPDPTDPRAPRDRIVS